jgi:hypothetical protein
MRDVAQKLNSMNCPVRIQRRRTISEFDFKTAF